MRAIMNFQLPIFAVLLNWKVSTALNSTKETSVAEQLRIIAGNESLTNLSREGKSYGSFGSYGSYGSGSGGFSHEVFDVTVVKQLECPFAYTEVDDLCLAYLPCTPTGGSPTSYSFDDARAYCQSLDTGGGDLVTFKDANEYQSIVNYILQMDPGYLCSYWLGATLDTSAYQFVDGTYLSNSGPFWNINEPPVGTANPYILFSNTYLYRLVTSDGAGFAGAICQYRPGNVTLTQRIYPRRQPQVIPIPYPVAVEKDRHGGHGGHGGGGSNITTNLGITLPGSNFSSEQNANFQNAPVINIETHSHFIDSSPEIIPIPSYPLPPNGTSYGSPPYPQPGYPYNTYIPMPPYNNTYIPMPPYNNTYFPMPPYNNTYFPMPPYNNPSYPMPTYNNPSYPMYSGGTAPWPLRVNSPITVNRPHSITNSRLSMGNAVVSNVQNKIPPILVSRDDKLKGSASNRTNSQKINKESTFSSKPKSHPAVYNTVHIERIDGFKQRSRENAPALNIGAPPLSKEVPILSKDLPQQQAPLTREKENKEHKKPEDVTTQLTFLLDMIDRKYGDPNANSLLIAESMAPPVGHASETEEAAYMIKIMNELQAMIAKVEHMENASRLNTNLQSRPNKPPNRQQHKTPIIGSRRMQGSRLLDI